MTRFLRRIRRFLTRQVFIGGFEPLRRHEFEVDARLAARAKALRDLLPRQNVKRLILENENYAPRENAIITQIYTVTDSKTGIRRLIRAISLSHAIRYAAQNQFYIKLSGQEEPVSVSAPLGKRPSA